MHRLFGLLLVAVAAGAAWLGVWRPYQAALAHAPDVRMPMKVLVLVSASLVFGVFFLLVGDRVPYRDAQRQRLTPAGWVLVLLMAAGALGGFAWMQAQFSALGYR